MLATVLLVTVSTTKAVAFSYWLSRCSDQLAYDLTRELYEVDLSNGEKDQGDALYLGG